MNRNSGLGVSGGDGSGVADEELDGARDIASLGATGLAPASAIAGVASALSSCGSTAPLGWVWE